MKSVKTLSLILSVLVLMLLGIVDNIKSQQKRSINQANAFFEEGLNHYNNNDYIASTNSFIRALYNFPNYYKARYWLGKAYFQSGYIKNALVEWKQVLNLVGGEDYFLKNKIKRLLNQIVQPQVPTIKDSYIKTSNIKPKKLKMPTSLIKGHNENYLVTGYETANIVILNKNGEELANLSYPQYPFKHPYDIVQSAGGDFFVSDFGKDLIHRISSDFKYVSSFGGEGIESGRFVGPKGLSIDRYNNLYVVDSANHRIQKFDMEARHIMSFGVKGFGEDRLYMPSDIVVMRREGGSLEHIYITDTGNKRIQEYDLSGNHIRNLLEGVLEKPYGLKQVDDSKLVVADKDRGIYMLDVDTKDYRLLKGLDNDLREPLDIATDANNLLYIADVGSSSLKGYVPESMKYNNLDIRVLQTFSDDYPKIVQRVLVKDQFGKTIYGLKAKNFNLYESGVEHEVEVETKKKKGTSLLIINEITEGMEEHSDELKGLLEKVFLGMGEDDKVKVLNFSNNYVEKQGFVNDKSYSLKLLFSKEGINDASDGRGRGRGGGDRRELGGVIHKGLTSLIKRSIDTQVALLLISKGDINEESLLPYGHEVCVNYAKNNLIPIYVLSFGKAGGKGDYLLKELAQGTEGKYFHAYRSQDTKDLLKMIKKRKEEIYYIRHKSRFISLEGGHKQPLHNRWRDIRLEIKVNELMGQDKSEYYIYR